MSHYEIPGYDEWKAKEPEPLPTYRFGVDVVMNITVEAVDNDHARELAEAVANSLKTKDIDYIEIASIQEL